MPCSIAREHSCVGRDRECQAPPCRPSASQTTKRSDQDKPQWQQGLAGFISRRGRQKKVSVICGRFERSVRRAFILLPCHRSRHLESRTHHLLLLSPLSAVRSLSARSARNLPRHRLDPSRPATSYQGAGAPSVATLVCFGRPPPASRRHSPPWRCLLCRGVAWPPAWHPVAYYSSCEVSATPPWPHCSRQPPQMRLLQQRPRQLRRLQPLA